MTIRVFGSASLALLVASCGGRVDDSASLRTESANTPSSVAPASGCEDVCVRFHTCSTSNADPSCARSCANDLPDPSAQRAYASCIESLSCEEIERSMSMNIGPIGECYTKARDR